MNTSKLAVVYVRVSTENQIDNYSVQDQRSLTSLAQRYGFERVEVREEQGVSAETITARAVMQGILEDISKEIIGAVTVSSFTRLTRDIDDIDGRIIKKTCRDHDCAIITPEKMYDFSNEADDDLADLQFFFSKIQKRMNLKPMIRGEYTKAKNGGFVGLALSVGYDYQWKEEVTAKGSRFAADLVINEEEANVVRYIHDLFPQYLYRQIAVHLNELAAQGKMMHFPIKYAKLREKYGMTHRPWLESDIRQIIKNDLYIGRLQYAVNSKSTYLRGLDPIYIYRQELRILPDDVFERNQQVAAMRRKIPARSKASPNLFAGILRCPLCGNHMTGRRQVRPRKSGAVVEYVYTCAGYNAGGPHECPGYFINEREILRALLPALTELVHTNLREHLKDTSTANPLYAQMEGELKAELAKVNQGMKNLLEAVKRGALSMEQVKEENAELQDTRRRLEKRLNDLQDATRITGEVSAILDSFDNDLGQMLTILMEDRLRFNTFMRIFFSALVIEIDRPGLGWKKGRKKGEPIVYNPRLTKFALEPTFAAFVDKSGFELPDAFKKAERQLPAVPSENLGSPRCQQR
jgi:site-specific DNA recombinase